MHKHGACCRYLQSWLGQRRGSRSLPVRVLCTVFASCCESKVGRLSCRSADCSMNRRRRQRHHSYARSLSSSAFDCKESGHLQQRVSDDHIVEARLMSLRWSFMLLRLPTSTQAGRVCFTANHFVADRGRQVSLEAERERVFRDKLAVVRRARQHGSFSSRFRWLPRSVRRTSSNSLQRRVHSDQGSIGSSRCYRS